MRAWIGWSVLGIGVIHTAFGFVFFGEVFAPWFRDGIVNSLGEAAPPLRNIAFWFFFTGFVLMILGGMVEYVERRGMPLPVFLPWSLLAMAIVGCVLMPASGFWLLLVPVAGMFVRMRRIA